MTAPASPLPPASPRPAPSKASSWILTILIFAGLLGGCSVMAGDIDHWPASLLAIAVMIPVKIVNDRIKVLSWPMEFILIAGVTMIVFNLVRLYFLPLPY